MARSNEITSVIIMTNTLRPNRPIKVLHVAGDKMGKGAIQNWLVQVLRHIDTSKFQFDVVVHTNDVGEQDDEVRSLGARIIPCLNKRQPWLYQKNLHNILQQHGPYDIIHSHVADFSGLVMRVAYKAGIPIRIPHSHTNPTFSQEQWGWYWRLRLLVMRRWFRKYATHFIAVSHNALSMYGTDWVKKQKYYIVPCTPIFHSFHEKHDSTEIRNSLHIPRGAQVIGHVGRFIEAKNHFFILEIAKEVAKQLPQSRLLLVGDGSLLASVKEKAATLGLSDRIIFTGFRSDVPRLLLGAMDLFLFPSFFEGLGIALVEAQAAGLPCIFSDVIPLEVEAVPSLTNRFSLTSPPADWAETIVHLLKEKDRISPKEALAMVEKKFDIHSSAKSLEEIYESAFAYIQN
jgi:glycosyltransferase involved in cell wall biosynthesis